jgi:hypothetical protein
MLVGVKVNWMFGGVHESCTSFEKANFEEAHGRWNNSVKSVVEFPLEVEQLEAGTVGENVLKEGHFYWALNCHAFLSFR